MHARVLFGVASLVAVAGMLWGSVTPARACTIDEDAEPPDLVEESELIIAGRVTSWRADYPSNLSELHTAMVPIDVTVSVDEVLKGRAPTDASFRQPIGLKYNGDYEDRPPDSPYFEWGMETSCGHTGFQADPTGTYLIVGLHRLGQDDAFDDGFFRFRAGDLVPRWVFFQGANPSGREYEEALHLATPHHFPLFPAAIAATLGPLAFLAGAAFVWRRGG